MDIKIGDKVELYGGDEFGTERGIVIVLPFIIQWGDNLDDIEDWSGIESSFFDMGGKIL